MNRHLFVYGSLVAAAGHPNGQRLRQEALLIGPATIEGRLYRVSWYPALRPAETPADRVHGELYKLANPEHSLSWLDDYEGLTPGGQSAATPDPYERAERDVRLTDGGTVATWVYLYRLPLPPAQFIEDGRWRG